MPHMHRSSVGEVDAHVRHVFAISSYWGYFSDFFHFIFSSRDRFNVKVAGIHEKIMILPQYWQLELNARSLCQYFSYSLWLESFESIPLFINCKLSLNLYYTVEICSDFSNKRNSVWIFILILGHFWNHLPQKRALLHLFERGSYSTYYFK